jgi:hypothetical protein
VSAPVATAPPSVASADALASPEPRGAAWLARVGPDTLLALALGALMAAVALGAGGGLQLGRTTVVEVGLQATGGALAALALLLTGGRRFHGGGALGLLALLTAVTATSIAWAVQPQDAWLETSRTLAYLATFGGGIALVRLAPGRYGALVGATVIASAVICGYALATKVFPGALNPEETFARLREPFGYWNAVGLAAALGGPGCLWLGARRHGHAALNALACPTFALLIVTLLLAYSRGALLALAVGCVAWFVVVPLRLRGASVLGISTLGALGVVAWVFAQQSLSSDNVELPLRETAGLELGLLLVAMVLLTLAAGLAVGFRTAQRAPGSETRRRAGTAILVAIALVPVGAGIGLAASQRGLGGSLSDGFNQLFDPNASAKASPGNDSSRLASVGSVRARYFADSLVLFSDRPLLGFGAGGFATARPRVRPDELDVRHAHSFVFQSLSDLGLLGSLTALALFVAWGWAALRATALLRRRGNVKPVLDAELVGLRTMLAVVIVFGVHSFVDWTWVIPGNAVVALLCAGWLAGRGPSRSALGERLLVSTRLPSLRAAAAVRPRLIATVAVLAVTAGCAWASYQPQRAANASDGALLALEAGKVNRARDLVDKAISIDPLTIEPYFNLAVIETTAKRPAAARAALEHAVTLQPENATPWLRLAEYDAGRGDAKRAIAALRPALYLDPKNANAVSLFLDVTRRTATPSAAPPTP